MGLEKKELPARPDVVSHILETAEHGNIKMDDHRHGAIHGTSIETLSLILQTGEIPGTGEGIEDEFYDRGDISIYPTKTFLDLARDIGSEYMIGRILNYPYDSISGSIYYAKMAAQEHYFLSTLGLSFEDDEHREMALELFGAIEFEGSPWHKEVDRRPRIEYFVKKGIPEITVSKTIEQSLQRRGFLFGLSPAIQENKSLLLLEGAQGDADMKIRTFGKGLAYGYISGIQPLGPVEERFLEGLRFGSNFRAR